MSFLEARAKLPPRTLQRTGGRWRSSPSRGKAPRGVFGRFGKVLLERPLPPSHPPLSQREWDPAPWRSTTWPWRFRRDP